MSEEQKFNISIDRVDKIPVPLLVVGLGGTGCDALLTIKQTFAQRYVLPKDAKGQDLPAPMKTAYLALDSRTQRPEGLEVGEYVDLTLPGLDKILADQKELLTPYERTWVNRNLRHSSNGIGMGTVRQAARLALSRNYDKVNQAIRGALANVISVSAGSSDGKANQVEIVVVTGIGGGTGSGIFLDICQLLRAAAKATTTIPAKLTGYIVMPDVSLMNVAASSGMEDPIRHNAYAALKELDFWMRVREHEIPYTMYYGTGVPVEWKEPPFDYCVLMSASNVEGVRYKDGYMAVRNTIAENLMHYMAREDAIGTQYSYRQYEDNLAAIKVRRSYPLFYGYRAIGAFTKRIPKKSVLYYEGSLLLKTFVPLRDDSGKIQPDRRMFVDGQGKPRAEEITGVGKQLLQDFKTNVCKLPACCYLDLNDKVKVTAQQNMSPAPHARWHTWRDTVSAPAALKAAESYLEQAWDRFEKFATAVIMDPRQGPFALEAYLDAPDGMLRFMQEILDSWTNQYHKTRSLTIAQAEEQCANAWPSFRNPPVLGRKGALEQYDQALKSLYTAVNNCEFLEKHTQALEKLVLRVKEYLRDGLKPVCASVLFLEEEFNTPEQDDALLVQDIYQLNTVQRSIDEAFAEANGGDRMSSEFLAKLAAISLQTQPNVDARTSGVEFIGRSVGLEQLCASLQAHMEDTYGSVNNQSLDDIMLANTGEDVAAQQKWMDDLANSALDSALPMFMQDAVFKAADKAPYSYMSIPEDAKEHLKYITDAFRTHDPAIEPKASSLKDHIYVLTAWDKLPLFRYGGLEELRTAYDADLNVAGGEGIHLVRTGDPEADFTADWSQLPSPKPYFLFTRHSVNSETQQYNRVRQLVSRGLACGMITVRDDQPFARATVRMLQAEGSPALLSADTMLARMADIVKAKNPATGDVYTEGEISAKLTALLDSGRTVILEENEIMPANVANVLGLEHEPCNPFDPAVQADLARLEKARVNHRLLCITMTEAMIYARPDLVRALELQLPAWEKIAERVARSGRAEEKWNRRLAFAETGAELFLFLKDTIVLGGEGYKYKERGNRYEIVNASVAAEDVLAMESMVLKTLCFLADAPEDNAARADLLRLLTRAKRDYNDAVDDGQMSADEIRDMMEAGSDLVAELEEDGATLERLIRENPGRQDELAPQIRMAQEVRRNLEKWNRTFRKVARSLE